MTHLLKSAALALVLALSPAPLLAEVPMGDDGLHKPDWLKDGFKDLPEDHAEAVAAGRHLLLMVEQRGCIYCAQLHNEVLTDPAIEQMIRERFDVIQIDLFGGIDITDMDGEELTEKRAAGKWGVTVTPVLLFLPSDPAPDTDAARAAMAVLPGVPDSAQMLRLLEWASADGPATGQSLREVMGNRPATDPQ